MLDPLEWPLFVKHMRARPWLAPSYGIALSGLIGRRVSQRVWLYRQKEPHRGLKQRPDWLGKVTRANGQPRPLHFPAFKLAGSMPDVQSAELRDDDAEAAYQQHRWVSCVNALGSDERARTALREALDWMATPPARDHVAWETYSCCERVANLAVLLAAHSDLRIGIDGEALQQFFSDSAEWIDDHLEYYGPDRTNNHFLNNGRALVLAGAVTGHNGWTTTGLKIVQRCAPQLFDEDGYLREGSSHYQLVVAGWLFDALAFARLSSTDQNLQPLEDLANRVGSASARFAAVLPAMDFHVGDISPDLHPLLSLHRLQLLYPQRLHQQAATQQSGEWLFANQGQSSLLGRAVRDWPKSYTTHAHADFGSFIWRHAGEAILVDPGRQDYMATSRSRNQLGPTAHNTLLVNGAGALAGSVLRTGIWHPQPYSNAVIRVDALPDGFGLQHNGFTRLAGVGKHHRKVRLLDGAVEVTDHLDGRGKAALTTFWHFAPGYNQTGPLALSSSAGSVEIEATGPGRVASNWSDYNCSQFYGDVKSACCLSLSWQADLPCNITTRLSYKPCAE